MKHIVATGVNAENFNDYVDGIANGTFVGYLLSQADMTAGKKKPETFFAMPVDENKRIANFDNGNIVCDETNAARVTKYLNKYTEAVKKFSPTELPMWTLVATAATV